LADCNADFVLDDFNRDDFVPLVLIREGDALDIALRFAAMRPHYVRLSLRITQAAIVIAGTGCPERVHKIKRVCRQISVPLAMAKAPSSEHAIHCAHYEAAVADLVAARRSSIRSRSTSQYLSADKRSLSG
jgi:hypothetical protein